MTQEGKYFYGIIATSVEEGFGPIGIGQRGDEVRAVPYREIAGVVSRWPMTPFPSLPRETVLRHLAEHQAAIERVMRTHTIIPMKFGTILGDEQEVVDTLERGYAQFRAALEEMAGKMEMDVVALWKDLGAVLQALGQEEDICTFKKHVAGLPSPAMYEKKVELGRMVKARLDQKKQEIAREILQALQTVAPDTRVHGLLDDSMIVNAAFLLEKENGKGFDQALYALNDRYQDTINFRCIGPLPPYSFRTIEIEKVEFGSLDQARRTLGLGERATWHQIKEAHRRLTHDLHPDRQGDNPRAAQEFEQLSQAYQLLTEYCQHLPCSFSPDDVRRMSKIKILRGVEPAGS